MNWEEIFSRIAGWVKHNFWSKRDLYQGGVLHDIYMKVYGTYRTVDADVTLTIGDGYSLVVASSYTVNGTLVLSGDATLCIVG